MRKRRSASLLCFNRHDDRLRGQDVTGELLEWLRALPVAEAAAWCTASNVLIFLAALGGGLLLAAVFRRSRVSAVPDALSRSELVLSGTCVLGNSLVMFLGWLLFRTGHVRIVAQASALGVLVDAVLLLLVMDFAMYVAHRIAHHPLLFRHVHGVHHRYERVRPLTLFALHPLEVLGFGGLWLAVLLLHPFSVWGMVLYLSANTLFGVFGHLGVEPVPQRIRDWPLVRAIGTSTFHARHHQTHDSNFGFYTSVWDRLFGTLDVPDRGSASR